MTYSRPWPRWYRPAIERATVRRIVEAAAKLRHVRAHDIIGTTKVQPVASIRQAVMLVARREGFSLPQIGAVLKRDHSSVHHGCVIAEQRCTNDGHYAQFIQELQALAKAGPTFVERVVTVEVPVEVERIVYVDRPVPAVEQRRVKPKNDFDQEELTEDMRKRSVAFMRALRAA